MDKPVPLTIEVMLRGNFDAALTIPLDLTTAEARKLGKVLDAQARRTTQDFALPKADPCMAGITE